MESVRTTKRRISDDRHQKLQLQFIEQVTQILTKDENLKSDIKKIINRKK